jgi:hypothetical protein
VSVKPTVKIVDRDRGWKAMVQRAKRAREGRVKVGVLADDHKGGADHEGITVAELAVVLHFGTTPDENGDQHIPARPFLAMAFDEQRDKLADMGGKLLAKVVTGEVEQAQALGILGAKLSTEAKKVITVGNRLEKNADATVAAKGSSRPLVDTGRLVNAITYAIDKDGK